jgi:arylformamidase
MAGLPHRRLPTMIAVMQSSTSEDVIGAAARLVGGLTVHDVSPTLGPDLPMWFMYDPPQVTPYWSREDAGSAVNTMVLNEHSGTHIDAPFHFDPDGKTIDQVAPDTLLLRPYKKFDLTARDLQPGELIGADALRAAADAEGFALQPGDVAILECGWDRHLPGGADAKEPAWWGRNQPGLAEDACALLADAGVAAVASDTAACDVAVRDGEVLAGHGHTEAFLPKGILILEGLNGLGNVPATGLIVALPLKIQGGTGSPVRVLLLSE